MILLFGFFDVNSAIVSLYPALLSVEFPDGITVIDTEQKLVLCPQGGEREGFGLKSGFKQDLWSGGGGLQTNPQVSSTGKLLGATEGSDAGERETYVSSVNLVILVNHLTGEQ